MEISVDEFFQNQAGGGTRSSKKYVSIYDNLAKQKPLESDNKDEVIKVLNEALARAKSSDKIKNPELFFKFLTLLDKRDRKAILEKLTLDKFDKPALEAGREWVNDIIKNPANKDIQEKLFGILEGLGIGRSVPIDFSSDMKVNSTSLDLSYDTDAAKNSELKKVSIGDSSNGFFEDHLYFNSNGEQLSREEAPGKETVERIKYISRVYHDSGILGNSFLQEEPRKIIVDSMKRTGANTSAFVTAFPSNNSKNPNQKVVDFIVIGEPPIRLRLDIVYPGGRKGVLYLDPYKRRLTMLTKDGKEQEVNPGNFPNIIISEPVLYNSLIQAEDVINKTSTSRLDCGSERVIGKHTKRAVDFGSQLEDSGVCLI